VVRQLFAKELYVGSIPSLDSKENAMPSEPFDFEKRQKEKQASRNEDERALTAGEKTREQLAVENGAFAFPKERLRIKEYK
jgi:hypothetical protein